MREREPERRGRCGRDIEAYILLSKHTEDTTGTVRQAGQVHPMACRHNPKQAERRAGRTGRYRAPSLTVGSPAS